MSYNLLKGKKGLIFGALNEDSIAWKVAERAVEEGAEIVLTNTPVSIRMGTINQLAEACGAIVVPADATSVPDLENLIEKTMEHFGGKFDFILHSIGMSPNVRKGRTYDDLAFNLTYNLEPIYSIILAMIIFREAKDLNFSFYTGLGLIFLSVVMQTGRVVWQAKKNQLKP